MSPQLNEMLREVPKTIPELYTTFNFFDRKKSKKIIFPFSMTQGQRLKCLEVAKLSFSHQMGPKYWCRKDLGWWHCCFGFELNLEDFLTNRAQKSTPVGAPDAGATSPQLNGMLREVPQTIPEVYRKIYFFCQKKSKKLFFSMTPPGHPKFLRRVYIDFSHHSDHIYWGLGQFRPSQKAQFSNGSPQNR